MLGRQLSCPGGSNPGPPDNQPRGAVVKVFAPGSGGAQDEHQLIDVAPGPLLSRFGGADDRVVRVVVVRGCMAARGIVAAADVAADLAHPQMHPAHSLGQALFAALDLIRQLEHFDSIDMRAGRHCPMVTASGPDEHFDRVYARRSPAEGSADVGRDSRERQAATAFRGRRARVRKRAQRRRA
jgi:hypothetical protein